jgi:PAS domain S-box-containing protein
LPPGAPRLRWRLLAAAGALLALAIFAFDLWTPGGVAAAVPYVLVVMLSLGLGRAAHTWVAAAATSLLTVAGAVLSHPQAADSAVFLANRALGLGAIWAVAALGLALTGERRRRGLAEGSFEEVEARKQAILEGSVDGVITIDQHGTVEAINAAAEEMFGWPAAEVIGGNVRMLMPQPYRGEHDGYLDRYRDTGERRIIGIGREVVGLRRDGSTFPLELAVVETEVRGRRTFTGTLRDITERKVAEEALRRERDFAESLVETAPAIVLVLDADGRIVRVNRHLRRLSGWTAAEVAGRDWFEVFVPERHRARMRRMLARALAGDSPGGVVGPVRTRAGGDRDIEWHAAPLRSAGTEATGVLAVGLDITDRRRLEEEFRQAQKMEAIGQLAGGVAHDFNTVLASILGYSEVLIDASPPDDPRRRPAEQIRRSAERGAALTRKLLALTRRPVLHGEVVDLNPVLEAMSEMLARLIGEDIELLHRLDPALWPVEIDTAQIERVVLNLVVNAADAMPQGGRIVVATANLAPEDPAGSAADTGAGAGADTAPGDDRAPAGFVSLTVSDTGCGMDEETRRHAFDPFFTTKAPGKGTGLGLSTVYGIVQQSGGRITVASRPGGGSVFRVLLPRAARPAVAAVAAEPTRPSEPAVQPERPAPAADGATALLVEDDDLLRELLDEVLRRAGYTVLAAADPAAAEELCDRHPGGVDLLVSDMVMPGISGAELARRITDRYPGVRVCLMSGYSREALPERAGGVALDGDDERLPPGSIALQKPFGPRDFRPRIERLMAGGPPPV